ncbi:MAG: DUF3494 domain-containing protein [Verrucomicrobia bacterium]|nr:DUF3494 domain-containing protein [Verrucomicrobiota bacterium]
MKIQKLLFVFVSCFGIASQSMAALILGSAETFAVLGGSTVTSTGYTTLEGDLGVYSGTAITGFFGTNADDGPGTFTGSSHEGDSAAQQAQADALYAYNELKDLSFTQDLSGQDLGGFVLTPGVYKFDTSAQLTGILTLDGVGDYVFQIGSTLTTAANASILFINGANPLGNVFWQIGTSSTLGVGTQFGGTLLADQSHTLHDGARVDGRVIALHGAVTLENNTINIPEPASLVLMALVGLALLLFMLPFGSAKRSADTPVRIHDTKVIQP